MFLPFFCLANIYRPSLGKERLGRPNSIPLQGLNFYLGKKTFNSELHALKRCVARFSILIFIYLKKKFYVSKFFHVSKFLTMYIIVIIFFLKENVPTTSCCEVFADVNSINFTALRWIINACSGFET